VGSGKTAKEEPTAKKSLKAIFACPHGQEILFRAYRKTLLRQRGVAPVSNVRHIREQTPRTAHDCRIKAAERLHRYKRDNEVCYGGRRQGAADSQHGKSPLLIRSLGHQVIRKMLWKSGVMESEPAFVDPQAASGFAAH
jgi:hypothetical protein